MMIPKEIYACYQMVIWLFFKDFEVDGAFCSVWRYGKIRPSTNKFWKKRFLIACKSTPILFTNIYFKEKK